MELRAFLSEVATNYDRHAPMSSPTQKLLRRASDHLAEHAPAGFLIKGSGGVGNPAFVPWIGVFNPDETTSPQEGIYVVYLFSADMQKVELSLNQGITRLRNSLHSYAEARVQLASDAASIRQHMSEQLDDLSAKIDLDPAGTAKGRYQENFLTYQAANIIAKDYTTSDLPDESILKNDLTRFIALYEEALVTRDALRVSEPDAIHAPGPAPAESSSADPLLQFKPKDEADYLAHLKDRVLIKTRRHEKLVREYGEWVAEKKFSPVTPHPRDLVLKKDATEWLVEAKVLRRGNATEAVRAALGQLYTYRFAYYKEKPPTGLVALFSEPVGDLYVDFLSQCDIDSVWWDGKWRGTPAAVTAGLATE